MLRLAAVTGEDSITDLGAGDGRVCIHAAKLYGARAWGVELDDAEASKFRKHVEHFGLESLVRFTHGDLGQVSAQDLVDSTTVLTLFLLPEAIESIRELVDQFLEKKGNRVVAQVWGLSWRQPTRVEHVGSTAVALLRYDGGAPVEAFAAAAAR